MRLSHLPALHQAHTLATRNMATAGGRTAALVHGHEKVYYETLPWFRIYCSQQKDAYHLHVTGKFEGAVTFVVTRMSESVAAQVAALCLAWVSGNSAPPSSCNGKWMATTSKTPCLGKINRVKNEHLSSLGIVIETGPSQARTKLVVFALFERL